MNPHGMQDSSLPSMEHPRLNAPRILRLQKVATFTQGQLYELGHRFTLAPVHWDPDNNPLPSPSAASAVPAFGSQVPDPPDAGLLDAMHIVVKRSDQ